MTIHYLPKSDYLKYESTNYSKVCLDICYLYQYNITDSNIFYSRYYKKVNENFNIRNKSLNKFGDIFFTNIFSYHIICHMFCVDWPKKFYNIKPFKLNFFYECCKKCSLFLNQNNIQNIYTPLFATEIFEGNWNDILKTMNNVFKNCNIYIFK